MTDFATKVRTYCRSNNIRMCDLARKLGITDIGLSATLKKNNPRLDTMEKIASILGISFVELLTYSPANEKNVGTEETSC